MKGHYVGALVDTLTDSGVDRAGLLAESGLQESDLNSATLINDERLQRITILAARHTRDPAIGLQTGRRLNINSHGALGYAAMASETLRRALQLLLKYYRVQAPRARFALHYEREQSHLVCDPSFTVPDVPWLTAEMLVTSIYTSVEFLLSGRNQGLEVWFSHSQPMHVHAYASTFSVPVQFACPFNGLIIPEALAALPLLSADAVASSIFERRCEVSRQELLQDGLAASIRRLQSQGNFLSQVEVAQELNMSVSKLHRRMAEEKIDYKGLIAEIKRELALEHLRDGILTVEEIAHILEFSDASNFRRAFVGWTGRTPSDVRRSEGVR